MARREGKKDGIVRGIVRILLCALLLVASGIAVLVALNWNMLQRVVFGGIHAHETVPPALPADINRPAILVFSKTNGFRDDASIEAANVMLRSLAKKNGWGYFQTENGAAFSPAILSRFDAVVFNSVSGDVFNMAQRAALKSYIEKGGGFVGIHGAGGDLSYDWKWYVDTLIGAQFKGHPMWPQFQDGAIRVEDRTHPATRDLPSVWRRTEEWYSFERSPRRSGYHILLTLDEDSFANHSMFGTDLKMGAHHPLAWWHCVGRGRVFYSALGHQPESYTEPLHRRLLQGAIDWTMTGQACRASATVSAPAEVASK
ncbi:MAG TPA: ThuA domain-containing protein [Sphingobium sp.]|uniref:ThuA domain-containing protein n=1 Tax=Sphingobium sp. TaxID=1912891 RepID=UPI002ED043E2